MALSSYAFDLHLQSTDMISIITSIASRSVAPLHGCPSSPATITTTWNKAITRWIDTHVLTKLKENHKAPSGCRLTIRNIAYIIYNHNHGHITSQHTLAKQSYMPLISFAYFMWFGLSISVILNYEQEPQCWCLNYQVPIVNWIYTMMGETDTRKATYAIQVTCQAWSKSHERCHVRLARAASSQHTARCKVHKK